MGEVARSAVGGVQYQWIVADFQATVGCGKSKIYRIANLFGVDKYG